MAPDIRGSHSHDPRPWWAGVSGGQYTEVQDISESEEGKMEIPKGVKVPRAESPKAAKRNKGLVGKSPILAGDPNRCFHELLFVYQGMSAAILLQCMPIAPVISFHNQLGVWRRWGVLRKVCYVRLPHGDRPHLCLMVSRRWSRPWV